MVTAAISVQDRLESVDAVFALTSRWTQASLIAVGIEQRWLKRYAKAAGQSRPTDRW